jgi:hypothetical protein
MAEPHQQVEINGVPYSPVTFEDFASHTKYSLFGVPRYRWSNKQVGILATFSTKNLTFSRKDFARFDKTMGNFAYLKPPSGGDAGPCIAPAPAFDDRSWGVAGAHWEAFSAGNGGGELVPRFFFLGTIIFDRSVFRSHYVALDAIHFAGSHSGETALPELASLNGAPAAAGA